MKTLTSERFFRIHHAKPDPQTIARQLRKPSGEVADKVVSKMNKANAPMYDLTLDTLQLTDGDSILEIGFGSGHFFQRLFDQAADLRICGIDHSPEMVEMARATNQKYIETNQLTIDLGNSNNLPYPDDTFDIVFCNMVIYFWDQPEKHLAEVHRVLKPNGRFYTGLRSKSSMQKLPFIKHGFNLYGLDEWSSILQSNGFSVSEVVEKLDPAAEIEGEEMQMESICIVSVKN